MADVNPDLRAALNAARDEVIPEIRGLSFLAKQDLTPSTAQEVGREIDKHVRRRTLIEALLSILDAASAADDNLLNDGYPVPVINAFSAQAQAELQKILNDIATALGIPPGALGAAKIVFGGAPTIADQ